MKKTGTLALAVLWLLCMLSGAAADSGALDILKPFWLNALEDWQDSETENAAVLEPTVTCGMAGLEVLRSSVYMNDAYGSEAYVYAELKNVTQSVIRLSSMTISVRDKNGRQIANKAYAAYAPEVVMPGECVYVMEWLYSFVSDIARVGSMEITFEEAQYSRRGIALELPVTAYVEDGYLCAQVTNTSQETIFAVSVVALAQDQDGKILDILSEGTYSSIGIVPGSTIVLRKWLEDHAKDISGESSAFSARAYVYTE